MDGIFNPSNSLVILCLCYDIPVQMTRYLNRWSWAQVMMNLPCQATGHQQWHITTYPLTSLQTYPRVTVAVDSSEAYSEGMHTSGAAYAPTLQEGQRAALFHLSDLIDMQSCLGTCHCVIIWAVAPGTERWCHALHSVLVHPCSCAGRGEMSKLKLLSGWFAKRM